MNFALDSIFFIIFCAAFAVQIFYYLFFFLRFAYYKKAVTATENRPVSVIICAKNEAENLKKHLPAILEQDHHDFEVIVVDDCSKDETGWVLKELSQKYTHLKVIELKEDEKYPHAKKFALTIGIKAAKNELLLFTDADCRVKSRFWLKNMTVDFSEKKEITLGYGAYEEQKTFLNMLIRFDTFFSALQYFSFALAKLPYMGTGRNLAYKRSLFFKHKGFASHIKLLSGDDDLFVNQAANASNTAVELNADSHTISLPKKTMKEWMVQKKRHLTTGQFYKFKHKLLLTLLPLSLFLFIFSFIFLLAAEYEVKVVLTLFFFKILLQIVIFKKSMLVLEERGFLLFSPFLEIFYSLFNSFIHLSNIFVRSKKWK